MNTLRFIAVALIFTIMLSACGNNNETRNAIANTVDINIRDALREADPHGAALAIYASLNRDDAQELYAQDVLDCYSIEPGDLEDFAVYRTNAKKVLSDIAIVKPHPDKRDEVREKLYAYKEARMDEFRNYDILNAYTISQDSIIFDQGDYIIMLMLLDNEAALDILDEYIPPHSS